MRSFIGNKKGVTLVELMIVVAILGIVLSVVYGIYIYSVKASESHRLSSQLQQEARGVVEYMTRELSLMGYDIAMANCSGTGNDDGYPGYTNYGPVDSGPRLVRAKSDDLVFAYNDLTATLNQTDNGVAQGNLGQRRLVRYYLENGEVKRNTWRYLTGTPNDWMSQGDPAVLIENAVSMEFKYYDAIGNRVGTGGDISYADRCNVRRINVKITTQQTRPDPLTGTAKQQTNSADVSLPNMGTAMVVDTTAPSIPTNVQLLDPHKCGMINVTWSHPGATDLAGFTIKVQSGIESYYTSSSTARMAVVGRVRVLNPTTWTWDIPITTDGVAQASVSVQAYDTSGNVSGYSTPAAVITPVANQALSAPAGLDALAVVNTTSGTVTVMWDENPEMDISKYQLFRRTLGGGAFGAAIAAVLSNKTSYENTIFPNEFCQTFEYQLKAESACGTVPLSSASSSIYGDSTYGGGITDVPNDGLTNTTARELTPPEPPTGPGLGNTVLSRAGYKRNFMNWNNPPDSDLSYVGIRYEAFLNGVDPFPGHPETVSDGVAVEDINGMANSSNTPGFANGATGLAMTHTGSPNAAEGCPAGTACLRDAYTYLYSLFAVDRCGNPSSGAETAQTTVGQCGEEQSGPSMGAPRWEGSPATMTNNANLLVKAGTGCGSDHKFTWNRLDDSCIGTGCNDGGTFDLAGFYVYRVEGAGNFSYSNADTKVGGLLINPPVGGTPEKSDLAMSPSTDDGSNAGKTYKYYVIPVDCNRETNSGSNPWAAGIGNAASPAPLQSNTLTLKPGRVMFNYPVTTPLAQYPPVNANVIVGDMSFGAGGTPSSATNYMHNTVKHRIYNTSMGRMRLNGFKVGWSKPDTYLESIKTSDGTCLFGTCLASPPNSRSASPATATLTTPIILNGIDAATCPSGYCSVQLSLKFTDSIGGASTSQDMRFTTLDISDLAYTKEYTSANDTSAGGVSNGPAGTYTISCSQTNPQVSTGIDDNVSVPLGPVIRPTPDSAQLRFGDPVQTRALVNTTGTQIASTNDVKVRTRIDDNSSAGINNAYLYYKLTGQNILTPPTDISQYTPIHMSEVVGQPGFYETDTALARQKDKRMWLFMLVKDNFGNWDRDPELRSPTDYTESAYTYDMDNPCSNTNDPGPATGVSLDPTTFKLTWNKPTQNTDGSAMTDLYGYYIYRSVNGGFTWESSYTTLYVASLSNPDSPEWTDPSIPDGALLKYKVVVFDECTPTPEVSAEALSGFACRNYLTVPGSVSSSISSSVTSRSRGVNYYAKYYCITIVDPDLLTLPNEADATFFLDGQTLTSNDAYLYFLRASDGSWITYDDDTGGSLDSKIAFVDGVITIGQGGVGGSVPAGNYILEATTYSQYVTGGYTLTITVP